VRNTTGLPAGPVEDFPVKFFLRAGARELRADQELQFGAKEPDPGRAGALEIVHIERNADIHEKRNRNAVAGDARKIAFRRKGRLSFGLQRPLFAKTGDDFRRRPNMNFADAAVDDHFIARLCKRNRIVESGDQRNAERARDDRDMRSR